MNWDTNGILIRTKRVEWDEDNNILLREVVDHAEASKALHGTANSRSDAVASVP